MVERQLLPWQKTVQDNYLYKQQRDYLLVAVPGAGKTFWAMHTVRYLIKACRVQRVVIVVPTAHVKGQWARTAHELGLNIEFDYRSSDGAWPSDANGVVMTYAQMNEQPSLHAKNVSLHSTLVILDEAHHLQEAASWGRTAQEAFDAAAYRIRLSGTPWNENGYIPWTEYVDGKAKADYTYTYQESLDDGVNCDVFFPEVGGTAEWEWDGERYSHTFEEKLSERDRARRLNTFLALPSSDFIEHTFLNADSALSDIRQLPNQDRAGGMVIAKDIRHAEKIVDMIENKLRKPKPVLVTSDDRGAAHGLKSYVNSTDRWIVSVRMVSEGVDIPRLRVLVYATNCTTQLFFRQAVGRVIRGPEPPALVFLPADPHLLKWAAEIRKERIQALQQTQENIEKGNSPGDIPNSGLFHPVSGAASDIGVLHDETEITVIELEQAREILRKVGSSPSLSEVTTVAKILRLQKTGVVGAPPDSCIIAAPVSVPLQSEEKAALRRASSKLVTNYCYKQGSDVGRTAAMVNATLNELVGVRHIRDCTLEQLRKRYELANKLLSWL